MVIFSCVRAHGRGAGVGFLADVRRMNVGLTRARHALWILGHSSTLRVRAAAVSCWARLTCFCCLLLVSLRIPFKHLVCAPRDVDFGG